MSDPILPVALPIEKEVLAVMLLDADILDACFKEGLIEHDFFLADYRKIFRVIRDMYQCGEPVDYRLVADKVGDVPLIASLMDEGSVVVKSHAVHYVRVLAKKRRLRVLAHLGEWLVRAVGEPGADPDKLKTLILERVGSRK